MGARIYLNQHARELRNCELLVNLDTVGGDRGIVIEMRGGVQGVVARKGENQFSEYLMGKAWEGIDRSWKIVCPGIVQPFMTTNYPLWLCEIIDACATELSAIG